MQDDVEHPLPPPIADPAARALSSSSGAVPRDGFAALVPEFSVSDLQASLAFWCGLLGFGIAYERPAARFAYLTRERLQVMLCERNGRWEPGAMDRPYGRGLHLQMEVQHIDPILHTLADRGWPLFEPPNEVWYRTGDCERGQREFLVQDPDGYLLRFMQHVGTRRPLAGQ